MIELTLPLAAGLACIASVSGFYVALVLLSPRPIVALPSEETFRCAAFPKKPLSLPDLQNSDAAVDLSIVIPAFNEVPRLPDMLATTIKHLEKPEYRRRTCEIIIVDDGSTDKTTEKALQLAKLYNSWDIRVVTLEVNLGKGGAVRHGMLHSRGLRLLMADADGASRFEDLEILWKELDRISPAGEPALVIGSRAHLIKTDAVVKRTFLRNMAMYALHMTLQLVGVGHIRDTQCGFKLFTREAAQAIFPFQHLTGWIFDVEILLMAKQLGIPVAEVPINWSEVPESKLRLVRDSLLMFRDLLIVRVNLLTGRWQAPGKLKTQ